MKINEIWANCGQSVDNYFAILEFYDLQDSSIVYTTSLFAGTFLDGPSLHTINKQHKPLDEADVLYSLGGVAALDVYNGYTERQEYKESVKY